MSSLSEKMRAARENWVPVGKEGEDKAVCLLRPLFEDMRYFVRGTLPSKIIAEFAVKWRGVLESDLLPSGGNDPVDFDRDALVEWVADQPDIADKLSSWLLEASNKRLEALSSIEKN